MSDDVVVYKLDDTQTALPPAVQAWHMPIKIDSESDIPGTWQGSVADWMTEQVRVHTAFVTLTAEQYDSLFPVAASASADAASASPQAVSHEAFALAAFEAPAFLDGLLPPSHASLDIHGLVQPVIA